MWISVLMLPSCVVFIIAFRSENLVGAQKLFCDTNVRRIIFKFMSLLNHIFFSGKVLSGMTKLSKL